MGLPAFLTTAGIKTGFGVVIRHWFTYVIVILLGIIGAMWLYNKSLYNSIWDEEDGYIAKLANKTADIALCESQKTGLKAQIEEQNRAIQEWKMRGEELEDRSETQAEKIRSLEMANRRILAEIDSEEIGETCEDAMRWMLAKALEMRDE